jgi:CRISPR-associated protein Cas2
MLVVVSYDTPDDKRRRKIAKLLLSVGNRVQYSVFEAHLDHRDLSRLRTKMRKVIDENMDSIRFYNLGEDHQNKIQIEGYGVVHEELDYIIL